MTKLTIEKPPRLSRTKPENVMEVSSRLPMLLFQAARKAEEDAAIDAESILAQAEEANALDPVG